jgi:hypothetical protein
MIMMDNPVHRFEINTRIRHYFRHVLMVLVMICSVDLFFSVTASAQNTRSIRDMIISVEETSGYRFLFRDALIAGKFCEFPADSEGEFRNSCADASIRNLELQLSHHRIALHADTLRRQIILYALKGEPGRRENTVIRGQVIDSQTGSRLPYATLSWYENDRIRAISANEAGFFQILTGSDDKEELLVTTSSIGYEQSVFQVNLQHVPGEIAVRLTPAGLSGPEVIITGVNSRSANDTLWMNINRSGGTPATGGSSTIRYLAVLPSVSGTGALSDGLIVRGSRPDGFQVLLDGIQIFNQNHFFGMFDAFNADVLQTVGFYYDITPASLAGTPGGTLSVHTRTGSQQRFRVHTSLSNTSLSGTVEGPLANGRGSLLLAGRGSVIDRMNWFNGSGLVAWGLDTNRKTEPLPDRYASPDSRALFPGETRAMFFDLHAKIFYEWSDGKRLTLNGYTGGDNTLAESTRIIRNQESVIPLERFVLTEMATKNKWGNEAVSLHYQSPAGDQMYMHNMAGFSRYHAAFSKDDFTYQRGNLPGNQQRAFIGPFANENSLLEMKLTQYLDYITPESGSFTAGYALYFRRLHYDENSAFQSGYTNVSESVLLDLFVQHDWKESRWIHTWSGIRSHYYSNGGYVYLSPRLQARILPESVISFGAGYSRNYQFLHRLSLQNIQAAAFWILTDKYREPTIVDHLSGGVYIRPGLGMSLQAEVFMKDHRNLRYHQINNRMLMTGITSLNYPWFTDNESRATGLELMYRQRAGFASFSHNYTLSEVIYRNERINNGNSFNPEWDRRHQYTFTFNASLGSRFAVMGLWTYASGAANVHALTGADTRGRLDAVQRLDFGLNYEERFKSFGLEVNFAVYNVLNRDNTLYRDPVMVIDRESRLLPAADFIYLDVYDLGVQPSMEIRLSF